MPETLYLSQRVVPLHDRRALAAVHAAVVVALALWVRTLAAPFGGAAAAGAVLVGVLAWRDGRTLVAALLGGAGLAAALLTISVASSNAKRGNTAPSAGARALAFEQAFVSAANQAQRDLAAAATAAANGGDPTQLLPPIGSDVGLIVYDGPMAVAWAGRTVVPTDQLWERSGVIVTSLYVVQYAVAVHNTRRAVAVNVLTARAPASRLARSLAAVVGEHGSAAFTVSVLAYVTPGVMSVEIGGVRLAIRAQAQDPAAYAATADQSARLRGTALLALVTLLSLMVLWRRAENVVDRMCATAIPLAALAITPLNALSNVTRLFDPSTYYVAMGGPFTASIGALAITSALVLFGVMEAVRARPRPRRRWGALLLALIVAGVGPFLLRALSRGVNFPPSGAGTGLWLAWEMALFLAATSFLAAGVSARQGALSARWRGFPPWIAPLLAATAALIGPVVLGDAALWPDWYSFMWIAAIAALVLARRTRAVLFSSAFVAACGATVLLWGATLRERIELATDDVRQISVVDSGAAALLERFAFDLARPPVPQTREELLARYAGADLANADYAVVLAHWPMDAAAELLSIGGDARTADVSAIVDVARDNRVSLLRALTPNPAAALLLAVPHNDGSVSSALVAARTQLLPPRGFLELVGLSPAASYPPYALTVAGFGSASDSARTPWRRRATHLHSEWRLPSATQEVARVVADVSFDAYDTLFSHGLLVVILNLFVVLILMMAGLLADGSLARWVRMRRAQWRRSYRLQLSLALFAFFVVPALAFALWSYRRLQDDDRAARELVVRETLRRAAVRPAARPSDDVPEIANIPSDVPQFVYQRGQLVAATDTLLLSLAPIGRWLDPDVQRALANADELVATTTHTVGGREMLFGFRALAPGLVVAVPGRRDDLALDKRRSDLGVLVILATVLGGLAALGLSGVAARKLAQPIGTLRSAALAVAGGSRASLDAERAPAEFVPVFRAFDRMSRELSESEAQLSRAERVFAWGEMARQVAHEIKNPLTPIRLGVQHVLRAWRDRQRNFGSILEENVARVLQEIDHLDATARSFSRYGTVPETSAAVDTIDAAAITRDVAGLESLGADGIAWTTRGTDAPVFARANAAELREVLLNLCDNARNANARHVELCVDVGDVQVILSVTDDGDGVPSQLHARVFEPHFSTRTSGSGLGLAISRRLVEGWGGSISLDSEPGAGTTIRLTLNAGLTPAGNS